MKIHLYIHKTAHESLLLPHFNWIVRIKFLISRRTHTHTHTCTTYSKNWKHPKNVVHNCKPLDGTLILHNAICFNEKLDQMMDRPFRPTQKKKCKYGSETWRHNCIKTTIKYVVTGAQSVRYKCRCLRNRRIDTSRAREGIAYVISLLFRAKHYMKCGAIFFTCIFDDFCWQDKVFLVSSTKRWHLPIDPKAEVHQIVNRPK